MTTQARAKTNYKEKGLTMSFDIDAAINAAKDKRTKEVNEAAGTAILRIAEAASKAIEEGDTAPLSAVLGRSTPAPPATAEERPRTPRPERSPRRAPRDTGGATPSAAAPRGKRTLKQRLSEK